MLNELHLFKPIVAIIIWMSNLQGFQQWLLKNVHLLCLLQILTVCTHKEKQTQNNTHALWCVMVKQLCVVILFYVTVSRHSAEKSNAVPPQRRQMALSNPVSASSISSGSSWLAKEKTRSVRGPNPALCIWVRFRVKPSENVMVSWSGV